MNASSILSAIRLAGFPPIMFPAFVLDTTGKTGTLQTLLFMFVRDAKAVRPEGSASSLLRADESALANTCHGDRRGSGASGGVVNDMMMSILYFES